MKKMSGKQLRVGIVGCGSISNAYLRNAAGFADASIVACADIVADAARARAAEYGIVAQDVDALLADPDIDLVLNLTIPAAHFDISMSALSAGKHVFTEKPLAVTFAEGKRLVEEAERRGLKIGSAPDTFLGAAGRMARGLIDAGAIGKPVTGTAFMLGRGMEHWHPNPAFYYQRGAGPLLDMGPYYLTMLVSLLGPVASVSSLAAKGQDERLITAEGPNKGKTFSVETPTTILTLLQFRAGSIVTLGTSWDVFRHSNQPIELHGTAGSLRLPDPDTFSGTVSVSAGGDEWQEHETGSLPLGAINFPYASPRKANYRFVGIADLARSLNPGEAAPRASGALALHVLEIMEAALQAAAEGRQITLATSTKRPAALGEEDVADLLAPRA